MSISRIYNQVSTEKFEKIFELTNNELLELYKFAKEIYYSNPEKCIMSDDAFDSLETYINSLDELKDQLKNLIGTDKISKTKQKVEFGEKERSFSLGKVKSSDPPALSRFLKNKNGSFVLSDKLDGSSNPLLML